MRGARALVTVTVLVFLSACGSDGDSARLSPDSTVSPSEGVAAEVSGYVRTDPRGWLEICERDEPCAGVPVDGNALTEGFHRVAGTYDGTTLHATAAPPLEPPDDGHDFAIPCPEPEGGWPALDQFSPIGEYVNGHPDEYAGVWIGEGRVFVVAVTEGGDVAAAEAEVRAADPGAPLCMTALPHSLAELERVRTEVDALLEGRGDFRSSSGGAGPRNYVEYDLWRVERSLVDEVAQRFGDAVRINAAIVVDGALDDFRLLAPTGGVVTERYPANAYMDALGSFVVRFDDALQCFYFESGAERVLPVWPYGTNGVPDAASVVDFDGNVVASAGDDIQVGGGFVPIPEYVPDGEHCGADSSFVGSYPSAR